MIRKYLSYRRMPLLYFLLSTLLSSAYWLLADAENTNVLYSAFIVSAVFILIMAFDFFRFRRRYKQLEALLQTFDRLEETLFEDGNALEKQYIALISALQMQLRKQKTSMDSAHTASEEYYTLWVHQIKTPIAALYLMLEAGELSPQQVQKEIFQIERYVEMALGFIKANNLNEDMVIAPCDIEIIVKESVKKYAPLFIAKGLNVEINTQDFVVQTDAKWAAFIIEQLLSNAIKYTRSGGVKIHSEGHTLVLADTGIGIREEDLPRVFDRGYTGRTGRLDKRASGIGLYLSNRIAKGLGIGMAITSKQNNGTTVKISFPDNPPTVLE